MAVEVYLNFNGNCREAVDFYSKVFDTEKSRIMSFGDIPKGSDDPFPEEAKDLVLHTFLNVSGSKIMFSDVFPGTPFTVGNNVAVTVSSKDPDQIRTWFNRLKFMGSVNMELQETFWSKCYGMVTDKFGVIWQLNSEGDESSYSI